MWFFSATRGAYTGDRSHYTDIDIPDRPSPRHTWQNGAWALELWYDWQGLKNELRGTAFFATALSTSNSNAFALLMSTFDSASPNESKIQDFAFAIQVVRAGLTVDLTEQQLTEFRELLTQHGFPAFL